MKIVFLDLIGWDYTPLTPLSRPLGGTQSAICYLATELAARGHHVALVNHVAEPGTFAGVECPGQAVGLTAAYLNDFDVIVVSNSAIAGEIRQNGITPSLALWTEHSFDQPAIENLKDPAERAAWNGIVFVSDWQKECYARAFGTDSMKAAVLRNAISPAFEGVARPAPFFERNEPPVLTYTSTPFRGLNILLLAFPIIRSFVPDCRLKVYSSMAVYHEDDAQFQILYKICEALDGVDYIGSVGQKDLARDLADADILAYPNTYDETSCIAAMEAMASGCFVVTANAGALPETLNGHGCLVERSDSIYFFAYDFAMATVKVIQQASEAPDAFARRLADQETFVERNLTWKARAGEWEMWLMMELLRG